MANNCLVTKLNGVVDNDNLSVLGGFRVQVVASAGSGTAVVLQSNQSVRPVSGEILEYKILDSEVFITGAENGATMIDSKHGTLTDTYSSRLILSGASVGGAVLVEVKSKYNIYALRYANTCEFDLSELKYSNLLQDLRYTIVTGSSGVKVYGDLASLKDCTLLEFIGVAFSEVRGSIESLGGLTSLTRMLLAQTTPKIGGNWVTFVNEQIRNGRTSCAQLQLDNIGFIRGTEFGNRHFTVNDSSGTAVGYLSWSQEGSDPAKIDLKAPDKSIVYLSGYTQSEIDDMVAAGGVYEGYTAYKCD